ncbi:MAG: hypothetical protein K6F80_02110 [Oscillospiraceae bacterium]|nr:hypothetical protein [Oscillospiraceae bacterium]
MQYVLITLGTFLVFLLCLLRLTGGTLRGLFRFFVEELDDNLMPAHPVHLTLHREKPEKSSQRRAKQLKRADDDPDTPHTVIAILTHKIDERKRVVDSTGHATLSNEFFELVFETREGQSLRLIAPRAAFKETPFNQDGYLTYQGDRFVRFRYSRPALGHPVDIV